MFMIRSQQSRAQVEALETWQRAAGLVWTRWEGFVGAGPETRTFAYASYLSALDCEAAAATDLAALGRRVAA